MTIFLRTVRLALPTLFFGYGIAANLSIFVGSPPSYALPSEGLLAGGLTRDLDGLYKQDLPHMDLSFGLIGAARYTLLGEARNGAVVGQDGWLFSVEETRALPSEGQLAGIVSTVSEIREKLRTVGTDLVVVPLPAKVDIYRDLAPTPIFGQELEDLFAQFTDELANRGIGAVDARAALRNPDAAAPVFFPTDTHWTPRGATLVAEAVAASSLIEPGVLRFVRSEEPAKTLTGDLIRFVTTNGFALRVGLPPETVVPVVQTPIDVLGNIFGTASADIILVGTSYSANADWGFADALMLALGRDVISLAEEGLGPLQPMQHYLDSELFRDAPPAVVIWEIPIRYLTDATLWPAPGIHPDPEIAALPLHEENPDG